MRNVTKLTPRTTLLLAMGLLLFVPAEQLMAEEFEAAANIQAVAEQFVLTQIDETSLKEISARAGTLDQRLRLKKCDQVLEAFASGTGEIRARSTVGVRCTGSSPWTLYVPVAVDAESPVLFATRPLLRGERIDSSAVELRYLPLQRLPRQAVTDPEQIEGMAMNRAIAAGNPITINSLQVPKLIQQGQEVIILAEGGGISVRMTGSALRSGARDEMIPIRNLSSGKTLEARIVSESTVLVGF